MYLASFNITWYTVYVIDTLNHCSANVVSYKQQMQSAKINIDMCFAHADSDGSVME